MVTEQHILVVDDEIEIQRLIKRYFERESFIVHTAGNGREMAGLLSRHPVKLIILDVHLPGKDGFTLLREIKQTTDCAVVMLTSRGETRDRIHGLDQGADDYLPKPFDIAELLARSKAVIRRVPDEKTVQPCDDCFEFEGWKLLESTRQLLDRQAVDVDLTPAEFDLLACMLRNPGQVLNRDFLLQQTRGRISIPFDRTIDVRIGQLRKKLDACRHSPPLIRTIRSVGYLFDCDVTDK